MKDELEIIKRLKWFDLDDVKSFEAWRDAKLSVMQTVLNSAPVHIRDLSKPDIAEKRMLAERCEAANFAVYTSSAIDSKSARTDLRQLAAALGLKIAERHRSAESDGIVSLQRSDAPSKRGYIPYSTRAINWHTDGYYNGPDDFISAMLLHCGQPAETGGANQILDHEVAYLRLRDKDPDLVRALMHEAAMSIPPNTEADGSVRPVSIGPVFYSDKATGRLQMRYTARTKSIAWRDDPATLRAEACLREIMSEPDPLTLGAKLQAGQGVLCNNVLHDRTSFVDDAEGNSSRLYYRVRFNNRIEWKDKWPS